MLKAFLTAVVVLVVLGAIFNGGLGAILGIIGGIFGIIAGIVGAVFGLLAGLVGAIVGIGAAVFCLAGPILAIILVVLGLAFLSRVV